MYSVNRLAIALFFFNFQDDDDEDVPELPDEMESFQNEDMEESISGKQKSEDEEAEDELKRDEL